MRDSFLRRLLWGLTLALGPSLIAGCDRAGSTGSAPSSKPGITFKEKGKSHIATVVD